jgi:hypothetical protein
MRIICDPFHLIHDVVAMQISVVDLKVVQYFCDAHTLDVEQSMSNLPVISTPSNNPTSQEGVVFTLAHFQSREYVTGEQTLRIQALDDIFANPIVVKVFTRGIKSFHDDKVLEHPITRGLKRGM